MNIIDQLKTDTQHTDITKICHGKQIQINSN